MGNHKAHTRSTTMTTGEMDELKDVLKREIAEDLEKRNGFGTLSKAAIWAGMIVSILNAATLLWKGGELSEQVRRSVSDQATMSVEIQTLKASATGGAKEYMARNEEWKIAMDKRVARVEDIAIGIPAMAADIQVIRTLVTEHMKKDNRP